MSRLAEIVSEKIVQKFLTSLDYNDSRSIETIVSCLSGIPTDMTAIV